MNKCYAEGNKKTSYFYYSGCYYFVTLISWYFARWLCRAAAGSGGRIV